MSHMMPGAPRSRLAPTPSGYLHIGNALNFVLTALIVRSEQGHLSLRIDDLDSERARTEFLDDIFEQLEWLGVEWDFGPKDRNDFLQNFSQNLKMDHYLKEMSRLQGLLYACSCSRSQIAESSPDGIYRGRCRTKGLDLNNLDHTLRINVKDSKVTVSDLWAPARTVSLADSMGDFVVRRRGGRPAYQWVSLVEDEDSKCNLIVRGEDLLASSAAQLWLAEKAGYGLFQKATFLHHPLLKGLQGQKLSKSDAALSLKDMRAKGTSRAEIYRRISELFDFPGPLPENLAQLQEAFQNQGRRVQFNLI